jgi:hypothetical protein
MRSVGTQLTPPGGSMNGGPSRASEFYRQIVESADRAQLLNDLVTAKKQETDYLEFKGAG